MVMLMIVLIVFVSVVVVFVSVVFVFVRHQASTLLSSARMASRSFGDA